MHVENVTDHHQDTAAMSCKINFILGSIEAQSKEKRLLWHDARLMNQNIPKPHCITFQHEFDTHSNSVRQWRRIGLLTGHKCVEHFQPGRHSVYSCPQSSHLMLKPPGGFWSCWSSLHRTALNLPTGFHSSLNSKWTQPTAKDGLVWPHRHYIKTIPRAN